jgi:hypothetical protein
LYKFTIQPEDRKIKCAKESVPYPLVSISADKEMEALSAFLAKTEMPWTHGWNGPEGGIGEDWDVRYFPTIYSLDAKGIIRHKDLREKNPGEAVNELLQEMEQKK